MRILAQWYPNNEFRFRVITKPLDKKRVRDRDPSLTLAANSIVPLSRKAKSIEFEGEKYRPGHGMTPHKTMFGLRAKRTILRVGGAMDDLPGWNTCITLTLPAVGKDALHTIADYSSFVIDRFKTWMRNVPLKGEEFRYFYVWELQKRGALHIHMCVNSPSLAALRGLKQGSKHAWLRILKQVEKRTGVNLFLGSKGRDWRYQPEKIQVDVQVVRHSVSAYFAKYCSKDKHHCKQHIKDGLRPVRWWGCSRQVLQEMKDKSGIALTPVLFPPQAMGVISRLTQVLKDSSDKVYLFREKMRNYMQVVGYCEKSDFESIKRQVEQTFEELKTCRMDNDGTNTRYEAVKVGFMRQWDSNERRIRLYNLFRDDHDAWDIFILWMVDEGAVTQDVIVNLWDRFIVRKDDESEALGLPVQIDFLGDDWW